MPDRKNELHRSTLLLLILMLLSVYPVSVSLFGRPQAFEIGNVILLSMAIGIVVAYTPDALEAIRGRLIDGGGVAAISIWFCYLGIAVGRMLSIAWRLAGKPSGWLDTIIWSSQNALLLTSAVTLMIAPEVVAGRVPPKQWMKMGLIVAASVFVAAILIVFVITDT